MAQTRTQLRQRIGKQLGLKVYTSGTADAGGDTNTLVDAQLGLQADNFYIGAWLYDSANGNEYRITDSSQSSTSVDFRPALSSGSLDNNAFEIHAFQPSKIHEALNETLIDLFQEGLLGRETLVTSLVTGSPGFNQGFELFTSTNAPTGYTVNSGTVTQVYTSNFPFQEARPAAMRINNGAVTVDEESGRFFTDRSGETATLYCWAQTASASTARISLQIDGSENYSSYHTGGGDPELLEVEVTNASTVYDILPKFLSDTSNNADFTHWWIEFQDVPSRLPFPLDLLPEGPDTVEYAQYLEANASTRIAIDHGHLTPTVFDFTRTHANALDYDEAILALPSLVGGKRLYVRGRAPLTEPSADTGVIEVTPQQAQLVAKRAARNLLGSHLGSVPVNVQQAFETRIGWLDQTFEEQSSLFDTNPGAATLPYQGLNSNRANIRF